MKHPLPAIISKYLYDTALFECEALEEARGAAQAYGHRTLVTLLNKRIEANRQWRVYVDGLRCGPKSETPNQKLQNQS